MGPSRSGLVLAVVGLVACGGEHLGGRPPAGGSGQVASPALTGAAGWSGLAGSAGAAGAAGRGPRPAPPDASIGTVAPGASQAPVFSDACWAPSLPPETQPLSPASSEGPACAAATSAAEWAYPQDPAGIAADDRRTIVGRWTACDASLPGFPAHAGIEFGANGRWRLLVRGGVIDASPSIPLTGPGTSGTYALLGSGQLNLNGEDPQGAIRGFFLSFTAGMDALQFAGQAGAAAVYARAAPSSLNGADNPPSTSAGACSMVGTWDVPANTGPVSAPASVFSFDAAGNFVAGPAGSNLCDGHSAYGTYALSPGTFQLTTNIGLGTCLWWYAASYSAVFDASCDHLSLTRQIDDCTGGRGYFNLPTTLTRRTGPAADGGTPRSPEQGLPGPG